MTAPAVTLTDSTAAALREFAAEVQTRGELPPLPARIVAGHLMNAARAQLEAETHLREARHLIELYGGYDRG